MNGSFEIISSQHGRQWKRRGGASFLLQVVRLLVHCHCGVRHCLMWHVLFGGVGSFTQIWCAEHRGHVQDRQPSSSGMCTNPRSRPTWRMHEGNLDL
jgi:hypothetical protein